MAGTLTERQEREVACCCGLELQELGLPLELLPVAHDDACWLEGRSRFAPTPDLAALVATGCLEIELEVVKSVEEHLALHGKWEAKAAAALHAVMRRMRRDVKRRILDFQSTEPTTVLPIGRWWRAAMAAVNPKLVRAAMEAGKQSLMRHNEKRPRLRKKLAYDDAGDVLIDIPPEARAGMINGIAETMGKDYWLKWEETTRAMVFQTIQSGLDQYMNLLQIADLMDDAWPFDYKRAMLVARTECTTALNFGHYVVSEDLINDPESAVDGREWLSILDGSTRPAHAEANGQQVVKLKNGSWVVRQDDSVIGEGRTFIVGGERARFPGDPTLSAGNRCNCVLPHVSVSGTFVGGLKGWYSGEVVEIVTRKGHRATLTVNHPVLSSTGLVAAGELAEGDHVVCERLDADGSLPGWDDDEEHAPTTSEQLFDSLCSHGTKRTVSPVCLDLDGDERFFVGQVERPPADSTLMLEAEPERCESFDQGLLISTDRADDRSVRESSSLYRLIISGPPPSGPSLLELSSSLVATVCDGGPLEHLCFASGASSKSQSSQCKHYRTAGDFTTSGHLQDADAFSEQLPYEVVVCSSSERRRVGVASQWNIPLPEATFERRPTDAGIYGEFLQRLASKISLDEIVKVRHGLHWSGPVYDFETPTSYFSAGGIAIRNCRCTLVDTFGGELPEEESEEPVLAEPVESELVEAEAVE